MKIRVLFQFSLLALVIADENLQRGRKRRMAIYRDSHQIENRYLKRKRWFNRPFHTALYGLLVRFKVIKL